MTLEMAKYLVLYVSEARDHLAALGADLVRLETVARDGGDTTALVNGLFRRAHSVKGMSASMQLEGIASLAHQVESLVDVFRTRGALPSGAAIDAMLSGVDALTELVGQASRGESPTPSQLLLDRLAEATRKARGEIPGAEPDGAHQSTEQPAASLDSKAGMEPGAPELEGEELPPAASNGRSRPLPANLGRRRFAVEVSIATACPVPAVRGFLVLKKLSRLGVVVSASPPLQALKAGRIPGRKLDVVLETPSSPADIERTIGQISDLSSFTVREITAPPPPVPIPPQRAEEAQAGGSRTVRVRVDLLDSFLDAVGELILATARIREISRALPDAYRPPLDDGVDRLHATVKDLHDKVMAVRMMPLSVITERLPRAARDLARRVGKQVDVEVQGTDIEIDRAILDELADPLTHVLRNAVDHGIEAPHLRLLSGKPATGRIALSARRERDRVVIEIVDDGKGMDPDHLRDAAVARGAMSEAVARALTDREAFLLACVPGVSTADEVTDISGRGVGMDVVKRSVETLGGTLDVESARGVGTRWILRLPLTVAVQPVLLVGVAGEILGLPINKVHGAARADLSTLDHARGEPVLSYEGKLVPIRGLRQLLGFGVEPTEGARSIVVAEGDGARIGFAVDALLGQHEAVLKPLSHPLDQVTGLSAVTVLGNGRPVFILDVQKLCAA